MQMYLGVDVGEKRIGIALGNSVARIAAELTTLVNSDAVYDKIVSLAREHSASSIVVGMPRNLDGNMTAQSDMSIQFAEHLRYHISHADEPEGVTVEFQDESLTSVKAKQLLDEAKKDYKKEDVDMTAAKIILQDYLEGLV